MYAGWEPKIEKKYDAHGVLQSQKIQRTPDGPWENYYPDKAFPTAKDNGHAVNQDGMDLRDYFAAQAMQGLIAHFDFVRFRDDPLRVARWAYDAADAMMKAREEK